jgi:hypothetical protein
MISPPRPLEAVVIVLTVVSIGLLTAVNVAGLSSLSASRARPDTRVASRAQPAADVERWPPARLAFRAVRAVVPSPKTKRHRAPEPAAVRDRPVIRPARHADNTAEPVDAVPAPSAEPTQPTASPPRAPAPTVQTAPAPQSRTAPAPKSPTAPAPPPVAFDQKGTTPDTDREPVPLDDGGSGAPPRP